MLTEGKKIKISLVFYTSLLSDSLKYNFLALILLSIKIRMEGKNLKTIPERNYKFINQVDTTKEESQQQQQQSKAFRNLNVHTMLFLT